MRCPHGTLGATSWLRAQVRVPVPGRRAGVQRRQRRVHRGGGRARRARRRVRRAGGARGPAARAASRAVPLALVPRPAARQRLPSALQHDAHLPGDYSTPRCHCYYPLLSLFTRSIFAAEGGVSVCQSMFRKHSINFLELPNRLFQIE